MTDLTERSHAALRMAAMCSDRCGWDVDLLCALGAVRDLTDTSVPDQELHHRIVEADRAARRQVRTVLPSGFRPEPIPVIDVEGMEAALLRRVRQYRPQLVVLPPVWTWADGAAPGPALNAVMQSRFAAPTLVVCCSDPSDPARVLLVTESESVDVADITAACRWWSWLSDVSARGPVCVPDIEIVLVDESDPTPISVAAAGSALVLVTPALQRSSRSSPVAAGVIAGLLEGASAPVLLLPPAPPVAPAGAVDTRASFAALEGHEQGIPA